MSNHNNSSKLKIKYNILLQLIKLTQTDLSEQHVLKTLDQILNIPSKADNHTSTNNTEPSTKQSYKKYILPQNLKYSQIKPQIEQKLNKILTDVFKPMYPYLRSQTK